MEGIRFTASDQSTGLSGSEVEQSRSLFGSNTMPNDTTRSFWQILRANVLTFFNGIVLACFVLLAVLERWQDALFGFSAIANSIIGVWQEYTAKRKLDSLRIVHAPKVRALRDGSVIDIPSIDLVVGDVVLLKSGDSIAADSVVLEAESFFVDESILTGEETAIAKNPGDRILAGSSVMQGSARVVVRKVGRECYAATLSAQVRQFSLVHSEIRQGIERIFKIVAILFLPAFLIIANGQIRAFGLFQHANAPFTQAVAGAVAAVVAIVPLGLLLMSSIAFVAGAFRLSKRGVLVQELYAVEVLARVDVLCLDKTGTLTSRGLEFSGFEKYTGDLNPNTGEAPGKTSIHSCCMDAFCSSALACFGSFEDNETSSALAVPYGKPMGLNVRKKVPFSSQNKWSGFDFTKPFICPKCSFEVEGGSVFLGAFDVVIPSRFTKFIQKAQTFAEKERVLGLSFVPGVFFPDNETAKPLDESTNPARGTTNFAHDTTSPTHTINISTANANSVHKLPPAHQFPNAYPLGLVCFRERVRKDVREILQYFRAQNVNIKILSGDDPRTVARIAEVAGVYGETAASETAASETAVSETAASETAVSETAVSEIDRSAISAKNKRAIDCRQFQPGSLAKHAQKDVFARISPEQKKEIVQELQNLGHTVAMIGDGVNDLLALKSADLSIAMGAGSAAARSVAKMTLLSNDFAALPAVVDAGRRALFNIERIALLYFSKTVYALLLCFLFGGFLLAYPLEPRQLALLDAVSIGWPAFALVLIPTHGAYRRGFFKRAAYFALPCGAVVAFGVFLSARILHAGGASASFINTFSSVVLGVLGIWILSMACRPFSLRLVLLLCASITIFLSALQITPVAAFFGFSEFSLQDFVNTLGFIIPGIVVFEVFWFFYRRKVQRPQLNVVRMRCSAR